MLDLDFVDNKLGGCLFVFVMLVSMMWYMKPRIFFHSDGTVKSMSENIDGLNISLFGIYVIVVAIVVYYVYALFSQ